MKTIDTKKKPCATCEEGPGGLSAVIERAATHLVAGHRGVAQLYQQLVRLTDCEADKRLFSAEAGKHERLARETGELILPDAVKSGDE